MEPKRPYTETEPETAAETAETVTETAETVTETAETVTETAETAAEAAAPKKPRESFFRRQRRELSDAWREIYCNSRVRRIRTWQIAVFALMIVEAAVMAIAVHPAYWVGAGLLALLCVRQLFDRRPERHSAAGVVLYGVIAVLIGIFVAEQVL
mgnify:CR=1 FL=1